MIRYCTFDEYAVKVCWSLVCVQMYPITFVSVRITLIVDMQSFFFFFEWEGFHAPGQLTCCWLPGDKVHNMLKNHLAEHRFVGNYEDRALRACAHAALVVLVLMSLCAQKWNASTVSTYVPDGSETSAWAPHGSRPLLQCV